MHHLIFCLPIANPALFSRNRLERRREGYSTFHPYEVMTFNSFGGPSDGVPGADALTPVTVKLRAADHAPCSNAPLAACTRQKYVPFARPLMVSVV